MNAQILESCHDNVGGCHLGRDKTVDKVVSRYYWKGVGKDTEEWVSHCCLCVHLVPAFQVSLLSQLVKKHACVQCMHFWCMKYSVSALLHFR